MYNIRLSILVMLLACRSWEASAQALALFASGKKTGEIWPEADLFYKFNDKFRLFALASATRSDLGSNYTDGSFGVNLDYFAYPFLRSAQSDSVKRGYYLMFRIGYASKASSPDAGDKFRDDIFRTEMDTKFHLSRKYLLTVRNRFDWKISQHEFSGRYRPRIRLETDVKTAYLTTTPYFYTEYFLNFNEIHQNRFRLALGAETKLTRILSLDLYYVYQRSNQEASNNLNAFGIIFKVYLPKGTS